MRSLQSRELIGWGILVIALGATYWTSFNQPFHYDDVHSIVENPHIRSTGNIIDFFLRPELFSADEKNAMYRPLVLVTYAVNYAISEYRVWSYHLFNLLVHLLNTVLVYALIREKAGRNAGAFWGAFIFALHPIFSEPVNYISSRSESLCALFFLSSFLAYIKVGPQGSRLWAWRTISLLAFVAALLTKSVGIVLPLVLLLYDSLLAPRSIKSYGLKEIVERHGPYWAVALAYFIGMSQFVATALVESPVRSLKVQLLTQVKALCYYAKLMWVPHGLNVEHQFALGETLASGSVLAALFFLLSAGAMLVWKGGHWRWGAFWCLWALSILLPTLVVPLNVMVNEHRLYLPAVAFAVLLGHVLGQWTERKKRVGVIIGVIWLALYALLAYQRTQIWRDEETLWSDARAKAPFMPRPHLYLGDHYKRSGDPARALEEYYRSLSIYPRALSPSDRLVAYNNIGATYLAMGRNPDAIAAYEKALAIDSTYAKSRDSLQALLALEADKQDPQAVGWRKQGLVFLTLNRVQEAVVLFQQSLQRQINPETYRALALAYERLENWQSALQAYESLKAVSEEDSGFRTSAVEKIRTLRQKLQQNAD